MAFNPTLFEELRALIKTWRSQYTFLTFVDADGQPQIVSAADPMPSSGGGGGGGDASAANQVLQLEQETAINNVLSNPADYTSSVALEAGKVISASPAVFIGCFGYNSKGSSQFIQIHDSASDPANTAIPKFVIFVPPLSNFSLDLAGIKGVSFNNGIYLCNSSTVATKTIGSADCFFTGVYR